MIRYMVFIVCLFSYAAFSQSCHGTSSSPAHHHTVPASEEAKKPPVQGKCPIMGNTVDRSVFTIWEGNEQYTPKKVYFCCPGCIDKFKEKPVVYMKKLGKMKEYVENADITKEKE